MDERVQKIISDLAEAKRFKDSPARLVKTAVVEIKMGGVAFADNPTLELSRILTCLSDDVERNLVEEVGHFTTSVGIDGNTVGSLKIVEK